MKLKEIHIQRYGPLKTIAWEMGQGIIPIYGPNQSGKTLIVEALLEFFAGEKYSLPESITRVDEYPEGYLVIEESGKEEKITLDDPLCEKLDVNIQELINTLVVRNTDLQIEKESSFYGNVTDKITGLWTNSINAIDSKLRDLGRLTRKNLNLSNKSRYHNAVDQKERAEQLEADIVAYLDKARKEATSELEAKKLRLQIKRKKLETQRQNLELSKLSKIYEDANKTQKHLDTLPLSDTISHLKQQLTHGENLQADKPYYERLLDYSREIGRYSLLGSGIGIGSFILLWPLTNITWTLGLIPLASFGIGFFASFLLHYWGNSHLTKIEKQTEKIKNAANTIDISVSNNAENIFQQYSKKIEKIEEKRKQLHGNLNSKLAVIREILNLSKETSITETLKQAQEEVKKRQQKIQVQEIQYNDATLREVNNELSQIEKKQNRIEKKLEEIKNKLEAHRQKLNDFRKRANSLDFQEFLGYTLDVQIENLDALETLKTKLQKFIETIEKDKKTAETAVNIFRELKAEEKEKIAELFGKDSNTSKFFQEITEGKYERVEYDHKQGELFVVTPDGKKRYPKRELSGSRGTIGQLYLAVRIGLSQKLLNNGSKKQEKEGAFFILDDALTFSDPQRKERQYDLLQNLTKKGWQIFYLTSNPNVAEDLAKRSENEIRKLPESYT